MVPRPTNTCCAPITIGGKLYIVTMGHLAPPKKKFPWETWINSDSMSIGTILHELDQSGYTICEFFEALLTNHTYESLPALRKLVKQLKSCDTAKCLKLNLKEAKCLQPLNQKMILSNTYNQISICFTCNAGRAAFRSVIPDWIF